MTHAWNGVNFQIDSVKLSREFFIENKFGKSFRHLKFIGDAIDRPPQRERKNDAIYYFRRRLVQ